MTSAACAASENYDRAAYLAQAEREPPQHRTEARTFLLKAANGPMKGKVDGPAASAIQGWIDERVFACTPPFTPVEMRCRMRGLVDGARVEYVASPDGRRHWAALFVHTSPDEGNTGSNELAVWKAGPDGRWAFQGVDVPWSYSQSDFADRGGQLTYVGWTGSWMDADDHKGTHAVVTVAGSGPTFRVTIGPETEGPLTRPRVAKVKSPPPATGDKLAYWHNGSVVMVSPARDEIDYAEPSAAMGGLVGPGTTLFRGHVGRDRVEGLAYTFKKGCPPAAFAVRGQGYKDDGSAFAVSGAAPIREPGECAVVGFHTEKPTTLRFEGLDQQGDI